MAGNVMFEVDASMPMVISKAQKHVPCGELVGTTECITRISWYHRMYYAVAEMLRKPRLL